MPLDTGTALLEFDGTLKAGNNSQFMESEESHPLKLFLEISVISWAILSHLVLCRLGSRAGVA